jgi:hypothetical protein
MLAVSALLNTQLLTGLCLRMYTELLPRGLSLVHSCDARFILLEVFGAFRHAILIETLLIHKAGANLHGLDPRRPLDHALVPRLDVWEALKLLVVGNSEGRVEAVVPRDKGQVRVGDTVTDQPLGFGLGGEHAVENAEHPLDLVGIAFDCGGDFFCVQIGEPGYVAQVR